MNDAINLDEKILAPSNDDDCAKKIDYLGVCAEYWKVYSSPPKSREWEVNLRDWPDAGQAAAAAVPCFDEYQEKGREHYLLLKEVLRSNHMMDAAIWAYYATKDGTGYFLAVKNGGGTEEIDKFLKFIHKFLGRTKEGYKYWQQAVELINEELPEDLHLDRDQVEYVSYVALGIVPFFENPFQTLSYSLQESIKNRWEETYEEPFPFKFTETD